MCVCVCHILFVPQGTNISDTHGGGGQTFLHHGGTNILHKGRGQTFFVVSGGGDDDVDSEEEEDVSEVNIFASEVSKLSAGARILRGPKGPEILV